MCGFIYFKKNVKNIKHATKIFKKKKFEFKIYINKLSYKNLFILYVMSEKYFNFNELSFKTQINILQTFIKLSKKDETFKDIYIKLLNEYTNIDNNIFIDDITSG